MIADQSIFENPPKELSRKQVLLIDGIRYAAEIADVSYARIVETIEKLSDSPETKPTTRDIAMIIADTWAIIDSAHRFIDLIDHFYGLPNDNWRRILQNRLTDALELRDCVQHQYGELDNLVQNNGQIWGYLSWAEVKTGRYTGKWFMVSPGSIYSGDRWLFAGPMKLPFRVLKGRIRLNAFGREIYLGRLIFAIHSAMKSLEDVLENHQVRPEGIPAPERRGADLSLNAMIMVEYVDKNK